VGPSATVTACATAPDKTAVLSVSSELEGSEFFLRNFDVIINLKENIPIFGAGLVLRSRKLPAPDDQN